jgi:hypothetical protein
MRSGALEEGFVFGANGLWPQRRLCTVAMIELGKLFDERRVHMPNKVNGVGM